MTPTNLQDVRAAAERLAIITDMNGTGLVTATIEQLYDKDEGQLTYDVAAIASFVLATIPPDCQQAITAEWLSDVWGCQPMVEHGITYWTFPNCEAVWENKGKWYFSGVDGARLSNRHEATTLFTALGIQPRGITPKEGV